MKNVIYTLWLVVLPLFIISFSFISIHFHFPLRGMSMQRGSIFFSFSSPFFRVLLSRLMLRLQPATVIHTFVWVGIECCCTKCTAIYLRLATICCCWLLRLLAAVVAIMPLPVFLIQLGFKSKWIVCWLRRRLLLLLLPSLISLLSILSICLLHIRIRS